MNAHPHATRHGRRSLVIQAAVAAALLASGSAAMAAKPTCSTSNGTPYCSYTGKVQNSYVNASKMVIMYFDSAFGSTSEVNIPGVTVLNACTVLGASNLDFAKMFYASMLMAHASGKSVSVQMFGSSSGFPICDRIWVEN
jgi:hypothetical protein